MSGGSMDYLYLKVLDARFPCDTMLRRAFHAHLQLVAAALRMIEWTDSGDSEDDEDVLRACLSSTVTLQQATHDAIFAAEVLQKELNVANHQADQAVIHRARVALRIERE